eukprot:scaffold5330_cov125-Isochrysis_galbana.AAC.2
MCIARIILYTSLAGPIALVDFQFVVDVLTIVVRSQDHDLTVIHGFPVPGGSRSRRSWPTAMQPTPPRGVHESAGSTSRHKRHIQPCIVESTRWQDELPGRCTHFKCHLKQQDGHFVQWKHGPILSFMVHGPHRARAHASLSLGALGATYNLADLSNNIQNDL